MHIPLVEQVKIQARILVPLVKALRAELGEDQANALVRKALGQIYRQFGDDWWRKLGAGAAEDKMEVVWQTFSSGDALDHEVVKKTADVYEVDVKGCRYAEFFKEIGEPELGFLLVCTQDLSLTDGFPGTELTRTRTIMQGATHCDFRYRLRAGR